MKLSGVTPAYRTPLGACYLGHAIDFLKAIPDDSIPLVLTSPPFALRRKKAYGNVDASAYVDWFLPFAWEIHRILHPTGSFVFDLAGAWNPKMGTRSLFQYELILKLCQRFHLAQEFFWYNPSKLPTPAEWVTIRRTRVKDAVNMVWWLSKTPEPQADNRRVLKPYSNSMKRLLRDGYQAALRPSQHEIGPHFQKDNGGAIPPNLLSIPNCKSADSYIKACKEQGLTIHPARFPDPLPDFFIRFLTSPGDLVLDPFAGSNVTGYLAEGHKRKWLSFEINADYVESSRLRFEPLPPGRREKKTA
ncbi:MAG: site-specific DNA-methyltransferase [Gemmataceae bacterium]|nr:site-specific DNA-methyltransferase [Gemmataceae bacterium]